MGKINANWHNKNILGRSASLARRVNWHLNHQEFCDCRPVPKRIIDAIKTQEVKACSRGHKYVGKGTCPVCWPGYAKKKKPPLSG